MDSYLRRLLQGDDALMTSFLDTTPPRAPEGYGNLRGSKAFVPLAHVGLNNATQRHNLQHATTSIREKRSGAVEELDDWQELRAAGSAIKEDVAARMPEPVSYTHLTLPTKA